MITENLIIRLNVQAAQRLVANVRKGRRRALSSILKGAAAHINVEGEWNDDLMTQVRAPSSI